MSRHFPGPPPGGAQKASPFVHVETAALAAGHQGGQAGNQKSRWLFRWVVIQVLPEPSLDFSYTHSLAFAVVGDLVAVNLSEAEISRFGMGEVEPAHA